MYPTESLSSVLYSLLFFYGAIIILYLISFWKLFKKAGQPGWTAIVPLYNAYKLLKIIGKPGWWLILYCIPLVNIIFLIWTYHMLSKSFGKDTGFTIGLLFLAPVFLPVLAFGSSKYLGPYGNPEEYAKWQQMGVFDFEESA